MEIFPSTISCLYIKSAPLLFLTFYFEMMPWNTAFSCFRNLCGVKRWNIQWTQLWKVVHSISSLYKEFNIPCLQTFKSNILESRSSYLSCSANSSLPSKTNIHTEDNIESDHKTSVLYIPVKVVHSIIYMEISPINIFCGKQPSPSNHNNFANPPPPPPSRKRRGVDHWPRQRSSLST